MKIFSKLTNVQSIAGISIRPGLNTLGIRKVESIKKHPRIKQYFADGLLAEVKNQPKKKTQPQQKTQPPATTTKDKSDSTPDTESEKENQE